ncbi:hypothetical protein UPYG_G00172810 [Umbra pygmaea]|uniref:Glutathione hydrolase n=1 Tax=Umbra pygmaea TaxID=75934 RepID=A0ABD0WP29_UMBPY
MMDVTHETKLSSGPPPAGYKSFDGLPDWTVDDSLTIGWNGNLKKDHNQNTDLHGNRAISPDRDSCPPKAVPQLVSESQNSNVADRSLSSFRQTDKDPLSGGPHKSGPWLDEAVVLYAVPLIVAIAITTTMVLQIYLGTDEVYLGVLVTDHVQCTELGRSVLKDRGSSVDAAIVSALCLGIVHPHMSGTGGGGVMLVHDIQKNVRKVINFQGTAPSGILEDMVQNDLELKPGVLVVVPGLLRGLYQAHQLFGRMSWEDVVTRAANIARQGFNVSHSLAEAISKVKGQNMSLRFRDMFFPGGHVLLPGNLMKSPNLADVLEAGLSDFYSGNISQEIANEVQANGGVLTKEDLSNYSAIIEQPMEGLYQGFRVLVPPPPSIGAALISALNILEDFHLAGNGTHSTYHWIAESLKASLAMASGLGDPVFMPSVSELISKMLSKSQASVLRGLINEHHTSPPSHYSTVYGLQTGTVNSQVVVMGPDDLIVSLTSSLNRPFGSRILTPSGILLNSEILDFSWPNKTKELLRYNKRNRIQPGKRPLSYPMATIVIPSMGKCGTYMALGSSNGEHGLSGITQVLINALSYHKNLNDSISLGRLHPQLQPSNLLVDFEFLEEEVKVLRLKGHTVHRVDLLSLVHSAQRTNNTLRERGGKYEMGVLVRYLEKASKCNLQEMESKTEGKDKFFIVIRGKARKGFYRGCIGRVEAEVQKGELMGLLYTSSSTGANPKSGGMVKTEDTYPLTRHQAQLLLFVSPFSKRLELLCNPQLFSAICELSQDDLVVVKHKMGHQPGLVRNLMLIGKKENPGDLMMLGFEVQFVQDSDLTVSSKKPAPLPLFSAADIVQVVPAYSIGIGSNWIHSSSEGLNRKAVSRVNSVSSLGSLGRQVNDVTSTDQRVGQSPSPTLAQRDLELGSVVQVTSNTGVTVYGVIRWIGDLSENKKNWVGIELDYEVKNCSDGIYGGQRYFTCEKSKALFVPLTKCNPDGRFINPHYEKGIHKAKESQVTPLEETDNDVPPIPESEALTLLVGKMKGIQGHVNSCYLDATLFSLFSSSMTLDSACYKPAETEQSISRSLRKDIVNCLRRNGFVPADSVMNFRKQLGCDTFVTEERDPEEFITILLQQVLCMEPLLQLRSINDTTQDAYTFQIILDKDQVTQTPTVQKLLDISFLSCGLQMEEIPSCLMVQMPRFGKKYKMFPHIIPSTEIDITDLLYNSPRECFICGCLAQYECPQCLQDCKLQPGRIKQYCTTCKTQVHTHPSRQDHFPRALAVPAQVPADAPILRHTMHLYAVLCIHTSHYVSFVKYGPGQHSWLFFDSMADRFGDDQSGYNIPEIRACPEVGDFLSQSEEALLRADPSQAGEHVRRLLCDSYMCLYQSANGTEQINSQG